MGRECRVSPAALWMVQGNSYYYSLQVHAEPAVDGAPGVNWEEALQFSASCEREVSLLEAPRSRR